MNRTQQCAAIANVDEKYGQLIRDYIDEADLLDWSEATNKEIREAVQAAVLGLGL